MVSQDFGYINYQHHLHIFSVQTKMMKISWKEKKRNEEVLIMAEEQLYIIPTIMKRKEMTYFGHMIKRNNIHRLIFTDWNEIRRPRETGLRSGKWRIMTAHLLEEEGT